MPVPGSEGSEPPESAESARSDSPGSLAASGSRIPSRRIAGLGVGAATVGYGGVVLAMLGAPWFSPFEHALSDLGAAGRSTAPLFNGALVAGGLLGVAFVAALLTRTERLLRRAALIVLLLAMGFMALVGVFPTPHGLHFPVAVAFFGCLTLGLAAWGAGDYTAGRIGRGVAFLLAVAGHVGTWVLWIAVDWLPSGIAVPELVGATALAGWSLWLVADAWWSGQFVPAG